MHANVKAEQRAKTDRAFCDQLYDLSNALHDMPDPVLSWVGDKIAELADRARFLDARNGEDFDDRIEAIRA